MKLSGEGCKIGEWLRINSYSGRFREFRRLGGDRQGRGGGVSSDNWRQVAPVSQEKSLLSLC